MLGPFPTRHHRSRAQGWRKPDGAVIVDRTSKFGNPFIEGQDGTRAEVTAMFAQLMTGHITTTHRVDPYTQAAAYRRIAQNIGQLTGKDLVCSCPRGGPCHAEVLIELANFPTPDLAKFSAELEPQNWIRVHDLAGHTQEPPSRAAKAI